MAASAQRLTKLEVQQALLKGEAVTWRDSARKAFTLILADPVQWRLFRYLLSSDVRNPKDLPEEFVKGLATAFSAADAPASEEPEASSMLVPPRSWKLQSIETEGFGGINICGGPAFALQLDGESLLLQGPNGSGKSSLAGAILWALTGERPRDQSEVSPETRAEVLDDDNRPVGTWPPIACYPDSPANLGGNPFVRVTLTFVDPAGTTAKIERQLKDGTVTGSRDPAFAAPDILVETGLLMPSRMPQIRFEKGSTRLTDAVQTLTGLDELVDIGALVEGLCHGGREYLSTNAKELNHHRELFDAALAEVRRYLEPTKVTVEAFEPKDTQDNKGAMATFGQKLNQRAAELTQVVADDLVSDLDLTLARVQQDVAGAISGAREDLQAGLDALRTWAELRTIETALSLEVSSSLALAAEAAELRLTEAVEFNSKIEADVRFQLKALGAHWHEHHRQGSISDCPLCDQSLSARPELAKELETLRKSGEAATRQLDDNLNAISADLERAVPAALTRMMGSVHMLAPRARIIEELQGRFIERDRYRRHLATFTGLASQALAIAPEIELNIVSQETSEAERVRVVRARIASIRRLLALATWFREESKGWTDWWIRVSAGPDGNSAPAAVEAAHGSLGNCKAEFRQREALSTHLDRLAGAIGEAQPYRFAAEALRRAWESGKTAWAYQQEQETRKRIAEKLSPLKALGSLAESQARQAINDLSGEITSILERMHISERLAFRGAELKRKAGLVVRGGFARNVKIDATLVANTSWLRAVLWAFLFALRKEAVQQLSGDQFPVLLFDDPQATFDAEHRSRWAREVITLQLQDPQAQVILATYEEAFLELAKVEGMSGREAMIASAGPELGHIGILEGALLDRKWAETQSLRTPQAARDYMNAVRIFAEGMLQLMLRGQSANVASVGSGFVLGTSRTKLEELIRREIAPWNKSEFESLVGQLGKGLAPIKYMEMAHHVSGLNLTMAEATEVEAHWRKKLHPTLDRAYRLAREHQMLHGGLQALEAIEPTCVLPEGYQSKVASLRLDVLGRAAALSDGRAADGRVELTWGGGSETIVLGRHFAYRLAAATMEPVARRGDVLLVQELGEPTPRSLVVAKCGDRVLARRYELSENHSDVAVLTAQAVNPRKIAPPLVAKKATLALHKVIGVLFDAAGIARPSGGDEVSDCGGESAIHQLTAPALGLVQIGGQSAEPLALDGQFLLIGSSVSPDVALSQFVDRPVIAADADDNRYFKRLRRTGPNSVVLESLEISGDFPPVLLSYKLGAASDLTEVWPVLGVVFERPRGA